MNNLCLSATCGAQVFSIAMLRNRARISVWCGMMLFFYDI